MASGFSWGAGSREVQEPQTSRNVYPVTYALMTINVLVFLGMVARGMSFLEPTPREVLPWGADFGPLTVGEGQWWRMLTACFVHFGVIHIAMNMYVLYQIGPFIEQVFGRARYLLLYFFAGLAGSVVSLFVHPLTTSAGASGAIFGMYGAVFGFLLMERRSLASESTKSIARSAGIFIVYNFVYGGMNGKTDLSAHLGGLVAGFLAGVLLVRPRVGGPWRMPAPATVLVLAGILGAGIMVVAQRPENRRPGNGLLATLMTSPTVAFGKGGSVVYTGGLTEADARKLAEALNGTELGQVKDMLVVFSKSKGRISISVVIGDDEGTGKNLDTGGPRAEKRAGPWDDPDVVQEFRVVGQQIAPAVGGASFDLVLLDGDGLPQRTIAIVTP